MPPASDAHLIEGCLAGDDRAWRVLVDRYLGLVIGLSRRAGLERAAAEDLAQEVFVALWKHLPRLRSHERLQGWIAQTARRAAWRARKRDRARMARDTRVARDELEVRLGREQGEDPLAIQLDEERRHLVRGALDRLGDRCRALLDALFLRELEGYAQVAAELDMPVGSIGPTRRRCLEHLLADLAEQGILADEVSDATPAASDSIGRASRGASSGHEAARRRPARGEGSTR